MKFLLTILIGLFYTIGFAQTQLAMNQKAYDQDSHDWIAISP